MLIRLTGIYKEVGFGYFLVQLIRERVINEMNPSKTIKLGEYINKVDAVKKLTHRYISPKEVLISAVYNLSVFDTEKDVVVEVNRNVPLYDSDLKLHQLVDFISYGNLAVRGYPLLLDIFKDITDNMGIYFRLYKGII